MLVGLLSNTLGRADALSAAADLLLGHGAELLLHCGDVGGRHVLDVLAECDAAFIWGDRDTDRMGLLRHAQKLQLITYGMLGSFELAGKQVCLYHGDEAKTTRQILDEQQHDYLFTGHAQEKEDYKVGKTRVIAPGSLHGQGAKTVALVDLLTDEVQFFEPILS